MENAEWAHAEARRTQRALANCRLSGQFRGLWRGRNIEVGSGWRATPQNPAFRDRNFASGHGKKSDFWEPCRTPSSRVNLSAPSRRASRGWQVFDAIRPIPKACFLPKFNYQARLLRRLVPLHLHLGQPSSEQSESDDRRDGQRQPYVANDQPGFCQAGSPQRRSLRQALHRHVSANDSWNKPKRNDAKAADGTDKRGDRESGRFWRDRSGRGLAGWPQGQLGRERHRGALCPWRVGAGERCRRARVWHYKLRLARWTGHLQTAVAEVAGKVLAALGT